MSGATSGSEAGTSEQFEKTRRERTWTCGTEMCCVDEDKRVVSAVGERYAPIPRVTAGLDRWVLGESAAAPIGVQGDGAATRAALVCVESRGPPGRLRQEVDTKLSGVAPASTSILHPSWSFLDWRHALLQHSHSKRFGALHQEPVEFTAIDQQALLARVFLT